jgi:hypothetical protein
VCAGIEYLRDGERVRVWFDAVEPDLPVRLRGGGITFVRWGARRACYFAEDNIGGHVKKLSGRELRPARDIRAGKWASYEPKPVRILASRIIQINPDTLGPAFFALNQGEYIQGLLASISHHKRVYVVTVPAPAEYADRWPEWPRIVPVADRCMGAVYL